MCKMCEVIDESRALFDERARAMLVERMATPPDFDADVDGLVDEGARIRARLARQHGVADARYVALIAEIAETRRPGMTA